MATAAPETRVQTKMSAQLTSPRRDGCSQLRVALFGAGRMGQRHAENLVPLPGGILTWVCDVDRAAAAALAEKYGCRASDQPQEVLASADCDAVIIASPTDTHMELMVAAARAGKPILCEKPLDIDSKRVVAGREELAGFDVLIQMGFNRRFDPGHRALAEAVRAGEVGNLELCLITSRDPAPPSRDYLARAGGLFRDMMIHDFDMMRFISGQEAVTVAATGGALFSNDARAVGDIDTAAVTLTLGSGAICVINCSRRAVYGHDQRIEAFGEKGMLVSTNHTVHGLERYAADRTGARAPLISVSRDRYRQAYTNELAEFLDAVREGRRPTVSFEDAYRALLIADAAERSLREGALVRLDRNVC
jgi:myo-inositol 2-dehydrogenase/D-chiro-inositol 1-dehydrogenase